MQTNKARAVAAVESALESLAETLDEDELPELRRRTSLIDQLVIPDGEFSAQAFIADEVAREMHH